MVLSLGMVGALSIVRFRTAIKEPLDIAFLFWAIAVGIVLAAGMIPLAVFGSVVIGIVLLIFANQKAHLNPYIVVIRCENHDSEMAAMDFLKKQVHRCVVKSKTAQKGAIEMNVEVRMKEDNTDFEMCIRDRLYAEDEKSMSEAVVDILTYHKYVVDAVYDLSLIHISRAV